MQSETYTETGAELPVILGRDTQDEICVIDLAECPHILMAGTTGSGKSVCLNSMLLSLIESGRSLKFIMIDPKIVELSVYDGIPHLIEDVVTKPEVAKETLELAVTEMENRYETFKNLNIRNIQSYHAKGKELPYWIIVIDEIAELMQSHDKRVAKACAGFIQRLTQAGRAAGIHVIAATQRPTTDVISGTVKSNFPARIGFSMADALNSKTIIDQPGAEVLQGKGDMLYLSPTGQVSRIQAPFISEEDLDQKLSEMRVKEITKKPNRNRRVAPKKVQQEITSNLSIVYVMSNPSMPGMYKIGSTDDIEKRIGKLSRLSSVPVPFHLEFYIKVDDAGSLEQIFHKVFAYFRVNERREFFQMDLAIIQKAFSEFGSIKYLRK
ncbi:MAG: FtsK/SpoIIIE domain-containing protein [Pseudomonadota bacterium]